jgi:hypothetical protein
MQKVISFKWRALAWAIMTVKDTVGVKMLTYAMGKPYTHLPGYMHRWWLIKHPDVKGEKEYGTFRNGLRRLYPFYARFHQILRPDSGRDHHDHPFEFTSIILSGWYIEERLLAPGVIVTKEYRAGDVNQVKRGEYHRIIAVPERGVVTLVIHTRKRGSWGFKVGNKHIPWRRYHNMELMPHEVRNQVVVQRSIFEENT